MSHLLFNLNNNVQGYHLWKLYFSVIHLNPLSTEVLCIYL